MLYGLIGWPLTKTCSPAMHNAVFKHLGLNGYYACLPTKKTDLGSVIRHLVLFGFRGVNITVPYKRIVIRYLDSVSKIARRVDAVNTITVDHGRLTGDNTDIEGFYRALVRQRIRIKDQRVLLIGAGGAGRAAGLVLTRMKPAEMLISDISRKHSREFGKRFGVEVLAYEKLKTLKGRFDVMVNAAPHDHQSLAKRLLAAHGVYYDINYVYPEKIGKAVKYRNGVEMLIQQGARSFEIWTGRKAPLSIMRKAVMKNV